jgi:hypothetical protein
MKLAAPIVLVALGLLQMTGDLTGLAALKGIGAATGASPAPKVFSSVKGLETFSTKFTIHLETRLDECRVSCHRSVHVTPELYSRVRGPYNRRNVYGAALAYAPVLPPELRDAVLRYALCGEAPLLRELGLENECPGARPKIILAPLAGSTFEGDLSFQAPGR